MANDEELLDALVREYFIKKGGKVKRDELFDHFRSQLGKFDDQGTSKNRFGDIVNSLASLQNIEGEKYFVLKKTRNGTTPVLLRRPPRQVNQRKDKGVSLPASMRNFRFSTAEDALGNVADNKLRPNAVARARAGFRSESSSNDVGMRRNNSDTSITENGQANDSGLDIAVSESPRDSRQSYLSRNSEFDRLSQNSGDTGIFNEDDHYEQDGPSHVLTPSEKSWMMSAIAGNKSDIICQLEVDPNIVSFKDFIMGTALHWAAKQGNADLVRVLVDGGADVNIKSGFTPLHLATMHDKVNIINLLIDVYHANVHIRDHSGKEPKDAAKKNIPENVKQKLTDPKAAMVLEELGKKFPASVSTGKQTKPHLKKLGKILARKHNTHSHHSHVDGEVPSKLRRSYSEPLGSVEDDEDLFEAEEHSNEEMFVKENVDPAEAISDECSGDELNADHFGVCDGVGDFPDNASDWRSLDPNLTAEVKDISG